MSQRHPNALQHNTPDYVLSSDARTFEPALTQLRYLRLPEIDTLLKSWLKRSGFRHLRRCEPLERAVTYHALAESLPVEMGVRFRIHQRRSRLQTHHVEAFAGHLLRAGVAIGVLISTGDLTPQARRVADSYSSPRLRVYSGREFAEELRARRLGLRRMSLWHWVLDLKRTVNRRLQQEES